MRGRHARADARRAWVTAAGDPDPDVRRRAAELAPRVDAPPVTRVLALVADAEPLVREAACWAAGEIRWRDRARSHVVLAVIAATTDGDPLVREAAVASARRAR